MISTRYVYPYMRRFLFWVALACAPAAAFAQSEFDKMLNGVEKRYNTPKSIQMVFQQTETGPGRIGRRESGVVYLRNPKRMYWDYDRPDGKFFLVDGSNAYLYTPATTEVEKWKLKESDDMRAPLALLIGQLDFRRHFREFRHRPEGKDTYIVATPKNEKALYTQVEFRITPEHEISYLKVIGYDQSVTTFEFTNQMINPPLDNKLFTFQKPAGAKLVEVQDQ